MFSHARKIIRSVCRNSFQTSLGILSGRRDEPLSLCLDSHPNPFCLSPLVHCSGSFLPVDSSANSCGPSPGQSLGFAALQLLVKKDYEKKGHCCLCSLLFNLEDVLARSKLQ